MEKRKTTRQKILIFSVTWILLAAVAFWAVNTGGLKTTPVQLFRGLFFEYDQTIAIIMELRFPRIAAAILGGTLMAVSGVLMQAVMKNPLADPGIIGITSGATVTALIITAFFPALAPITPFFSFLGGMAAFFLVYQLAWNGKISPIRLILVGIAVDAVFTGIAQVFTSAAGGNYSGAASIINANISLKTWDDVKILLVYGIAAGICCIFLAGKCNLLALSDQTMHSLGVRVTGLRTGIAVLSVAMASIFAAVIGNVSFLGLIVPHLARLLVGSDNRVLLPYSACLGGLTFLTADTVGRVVAYPYEISAAVIMSVIGGPVFIILLKRSREIYG